MGQRRKYPYSSRGGWEVRPLCRGGLYAPCTGLPECSRCRHDAWASARLIERYLPHVPSKLRTFTHRVAATLSRLTLAGAFIDLPRFSAEKERLEADLLVQRDRLNKAALAEGMTEFSATNDTHIRELLFSRLHLPVLTKTAKDKLPAVDKVTLKNLDHPTAKLLID